MSALDDTNLIQQLNEYILDLADIEKTLAQKRNSPAHLQLLRQKINLKVSHFRTAISSLQHQPHSAQAIQQLSNHFANTFAQTVKEAHRLLQVKAGQEGQARLQNKLSMLKEMENEMEADWEGGKSEDTGLLKRVTADLSMLSEQVDQSKLKSIAKEYLHKQFLAIRMIAYKLYEQYVAHSHSSFRQQLQTIAQDHQQLIIQAQELAEVNKQLKAQEKRLVRQLNDLKRTNDLISQRYFVSDASGDTIC